MELIATYIETTKAAPQWETFIETDFAYSVVLDKFTKMDLTAVGLGEAFGKHLLMRLYLNGIHCGKLKRKIGLKYYTDGDRLVISAKKRFLVNTIRIDFEVS